MPIRARYAGHCTACHKPINVGDEIHHEQGRGARHALCPSTASTPPKINPFAVPSTSTPAPAPTPPFAGFVAPPPAPPSPVTAENMDEMLALMRRMADDMRAIATGLPALASGLHAVSRALGSVRLHMADVQGRTTPIPSPDDDIPF